MKPVQTNSSSWGFFFKINTVFCRINVPTWINMSPPRAPTLTIPGNISETVEMISTKFSALYLKVFSSSHGWFHWNEMRIRVPFSVSAPGTFIQRIWYSQWKFWYKCSYHDLLDYLQDTDVGQSGSLLIFNTKDVYVNILQWAYSCALVPSCIGPTTKHSCHFGKGALRRTQHANCHRFDQSVFNTLVANWWRFKQDHYVLHQGEEMIDIRPSTKHFKRNKCPALN